MSVWTKRLSALSINILLLAGIMVFMLLLMEGGRAPVRCQ